MKIFEDFLLRNKIVNLNIKLTDQDELDIWNQAIANVNGEFLSSSDVIHEDENTLDLTIRLRLTYSNYRKIIRNLQTFDRTLMYDPKTRLTYIIISVKNSLQKREAV